MTSSVVLADLNRLSFKSHRLGVFMQLVASPKRKPQVVGKVFGHPRPGGSMSIATKDLLLMRSCVYRRIPFLRPGTIWASCGQMMGI